VNVQIKYMIYIYLLRLISKGLCLRSRSHQSLEEEVKEQEDWRRNNNKKQINSILQKSVQMMSPESLIRKFWNLFVKRRLTDHLLSVSISAAIRGTKKSQSSYIINSIMNWSTDSRLTDRPSDFEHTVTYCDTGRRKIG